MTTADIEREPPSFDRALPHVAVDPLYLHRLLPFGLLYNDLGPWFPESLYFDPIFPPREGLPPWTIQLELHYQKFHPQTWNILAADDAIDSWFQEKVMEEYAKQLDEYGRGHTRVMSVLEEVVTRRQTRWASLYALHAVRRLFIEGQLAFHPSWNELDVLKALEVGDYPLASPAAPVGTVWPLPSEPPREDLLTTLHSIDHAMLFDHETPESRRAQPSGWGGESDYAELEALLCRQ